MAGVHNMLAGSGGSFVFAQTISANSGPYNLRSAAIAAGWNQLTPLDATVTINSGVAIGASSTGGYAFDTGSSFPAGTLLALRNAGFITGVGGNGGAGSSHGSVSPIAGSGGATGGPALRVQHPIAIDNSGGTIGGGGGGGGGGQGAAFYSPDLKSFYGSVYGGGGGGGRSSIVANSAGGGGGAGTGTYAGQGGGGPGGAAFDGGVGAGGGGGAWGTGGGSGGASYGGTRTPGPGPYGGGGAGIAVVGNSNITWVNTGTRLGAIT